MKEKLKNKDIIMEIIRNNATNNYTKISNKEIIEIAASEYNKKLYNKTISEALIQLEALGYIERYTIIVGAISSRTIYITNSTPSIEQKNKVLNIINNLKKDECLTTDEVVAKYCEDLLSDANIQFIASITGKEPTEKIKQNIYNRNKKTIQTILQELTKNKKIIEHRAVKKLGRNVPKKIKDKVQNLPTNTKYYISKKNSRIVEEEIKEYYQ